MRKKRGMGVERNEFPFLYEEGHLVSSKNLLILLHIRLYLNYLAWAFSFSVSVSIFLDYRSTEPQVAGSC